MIIFDKKIFIISSIIFLFINIIALFFFNNVVKETHLISLKLDFDGILNEYDKYSVTREDYSKYKTRSENTVIKENISFNSHKISDAFYRYGIKNKKLLTQTFFLVESDKNISQETISFIEKKIVNLFSKTFTEEIIIHLDNKFNLDQLNLENKVRESDEEKKHESIEYRMFYLCYYEKINNIKKINNEISTDKIIYDITLACLDKNKMSNDIIAKLDNNKNNVNPDIYQDIKTNFDKYIVIEKNKNHKNLKNKIVLNSMIFFIIFSLLIIIFLSFNFSFKKK